MKLRWMSYGLLISLSIVFGRTIGAENIQWGESSHGLKLGLALESEVQVNEDLEGKIYLQNVSDNVIRIYLGGHTSYLHSETVLSSGNSIKTSRGVVDGFGMLPFCNEVKSMMMSKQEDLPYINIPPNKTITYRDRMKFNEEVETRASIQLFQSHSSKNPFEEMISLLDDKQSPQYVLEAKNYVNDPSAYSGNLVSGSCNIMIVPIAKSTEIKIP